MDRCTSVLHEFENIETELGFITTLLRKQQAKELDGIDIRAAALSLSTIYNGIEKALLHILRRRNNGRVVGPNWHADLLEQSNKAHVISEETRNKLKGFMAFRHFVRHAYSFEIDAVTIREIIKECPSLVARLKREIQLSIDKIGPETDGKD